MGMAGNLIGGRGGKGSNIVTPVERPVGGKKGGGANDMMPKRKMRKPRKMRSVR